MWQKNIIIDNSRQKIFHNIEEIGKLATVVYNTNLKKLNKIWNFFKKSLDKSRILWYNYIVVKEDASVLE